MADFTAKKAKIMDRPPRIRHSIQLEVEPESEGRLQYVKSQLQQVKSFLRITSRTPMGNLLMIEKLLLVFQEFEQSGMTSQPPLFPSRSQEPCSSKPSSSDVAIQTDILPPYVLASAENTTGCFDIHTPSKSVEDYFIASNDLQCLVATMARYAKLPSVWLCFRFAILFGHSAWTCCRKMHLLCRWSFSQMVFKQYCWWKIYSQFEVL